MVSLGCCKADADQVDSFPAVSGIWKDCQPLRGTSSAHRSIEDLASIDMW